MRNYSLKQKKLSCSVTTTAALPSHSIILVSIQSWLSSPYLASSLAYYPSLPHQSSPSSWILSTLPSLAFCVCWLAPFKHLGTPSVCSLISFMREYSCSFYSFYGVYKEKPSIFKKYFIGNVALLGLTFIYSLILLIISSTKHQTAIDQCLLQFVSNEEFLDGPSSASQQVCNVWTYAQLGVCYFVWLLFCASQVYFCYSTSPFFTKIYHIHSFLILTQLHKQW